MADTVYTERADCPRDVVDDLIDNIGNLSDERKRAREARTRRDWAWFAMQIASDCYTAGSQAATIATIILLKFGHDAALDFLADMKHHEDCQ